MIGIFQGSPEGRANEGKRRAKGGQKEGFPGQRPKSRAKEGHDRAPSQKQGSLAAMTAILLDNVQKWIAPLLN